MLRDYQLLLAEQGFEILKNLHIVYYVMEPRVGKTLTALRTAELYDAKKILFITKKKAISSIIDDYKREGYNFDLMVINYEQVNKHKPIYDLYIIDEAHSLGQIGKPSERTKAIKKLVGRTPVIFLSGTPTPETYSQIFHQFWISDYSPFKELNFYKWAKEFVTVTQRIINGCRFNDYSKANKEMIMKIIDKYFVSYTREEAGFQESEVIEVIKEVEMDPRIYQLVKIVLRDKVYQFKDGSELVCDSAVKLQNKIHQIFSGTVIVEHDGSIEYKILDYSKIKYIEDNYQGMKKAIFYKFIAEGNALKKTIKNWTENPDEFNNSVDKTFLSQIKSGAMGVNLSTADVLLYLNLDFSSVVYQQSKSRIQTLDRTKPALVHYIFAKKGFESDVLKTVRAKKDYTVSYFKKRFMEN